MEYRLYEMKNRLWAMHQKFVAGYKSGKFFIFVNKRNLKYLRRSPHLKKSDNFIDSLGTIISFVFFLPIPITLLIFASWEYALASFILGLIIAWGANSLSYPMIIRNCLENNEFWLEAMSVKGIGIKDKDGNEVDSADLEKILMT